MADMGHLKKLAFAKSLTLKGVGSKALTYGGIGAAFTAGGAMAASAYESLSKELTRRTRFNAMLAKNPDLRKMNKEHVKDMFDIVHEYSSDLTKSPAVSGAFVRKAMDFRDVGVAPSSIKELVDINASLAKGRGEKGHFGGALRGLSSDMSRGAFGMID